MNAEMPPGPALLYVPSCEEMDVTRSVCRVDMDVPRGGGPMSEEQARRERALLRALLVHALWILDQEDSG